MNCTIRRHLRGFRKHTRHIRQIWKFSIWALP